MFSEFITNSSWYDFLIALVASAGLSLYLYFKNKKNAEVPALALYSMLAFRFLSCFLIALLLLNLLLKQISQEVENPIVLVAIDNSKSMVSLSDSEQVRGTFLQNLTAFKNELSDQYQVKTILFGSSSTTSDDTPRFNEKETDISQLFSDLETSYSNQNIGALVLVSDGIYNKGAHPLYSNPKQNYPIYTVAMGDTSEFRDVAIQKIQHNDLTYLGNQFPVEINISVKKFLNETIKVGIYKNDKEIANRSIKANSINALSTLQFTLNAEETGLSNYTVKAQILKGENNIQNNTQQFAIEVIDSKEKILMLANCPHPDIAVFKDLVNNSRNYDWDFSFMQEFKKSISAYNLVIIHGLDESYMNLASECQQNKIPYWIVAPRKANQLPGITIQALDSKYNDAESSFVPGFGLFQISAELENFISSFPAVVTFFGNYKLSNSSNALINQRLGRVETNYPLLYFSENTEVKYGVFLGDGLWRWRMRDFIEHNNQQLFNELVSKSIQYLTVKEDKSFFRIKGPKIGDENQKIVFEAELYNKSYELMNEAEVSFTLKNADNKTFDYSFGKTDKAYKLDLGFLPAGNYSYEAKSKLNTELFVKKGVFIIKEVVAEKINTVAQHELLYQLSQKSGGKFYYPSELTAIKEELLSNESIKPIVYSKKSTQTIINFKLLFWFILVLLSAEWFFRKRYLTI